MNKFKQYLNEQICPRFVEVVTVVSHWLFFILLANPVIYILYAIIAIGYTPNHDDGVPVTAAPLHELFAHRLWRQECESNMEKLAEGEYDWSHLAMSLYPARITQKAKKDWCIALTHGLEDICLNKPKAKRAKKWFS